MSGLLVAIDFTETLSKEMIRDSLKHFGFGPEFTQWV